MTRAMWFILAGGLAGLLSLGVGVPLLVGALEDKPPAITKQAQEVVTALDQLASDPGSLVPDELADQVGGHLDQAIPDGTIVEADGTKWLPDGDDRGVIPVTLTSSTGESTSYVAVMIREADGWKILSTIEGTEPK